MPAPRRSSSSSAATVAPSKVKRRFTLKEANRSLPLVSRIVADIVAAHNAATKLQAKLEATPNASKDTAGAERELETRLERLQSLVDELTEVGVELKDYSMGLVDFVGRHQGRDVYLCWKLGERQIGYWHELHTGFAGRQPVSTLHEGE
jgi:hypothetical protein